MGFGGGALIASPLSAALLNLYDSESGGQGQLLVQRRGTSGNRKARSSRPR